MPVHQTVFQQEDRAECRRVRSSYYQHCRFPPSQSPGGLVNMYSVVIYVLLIYILQGSHQVREHAHGISDRRFGVMPLDNRFDRCVEVVIYKYAEIYDSMDYDIVYDVTEYICDACSPLYPNRYRRRSVLLYLPYVIKSISCGHRPDADEHQWPLCDKVNIYNAITCDKLTYRMYGSSMVEYNMCLIYVSNDKYVADSNYLMYFQADANPDAVNRVDRVGGSSSTGEGSGGTQSNSNVYNRTPYGYMNVSRVNLMVCKTLPELYCDMILPIGHTCVRLRCSSFVVPQVICSIVLYICDVEVCDNDDMIIYSFPLRRGGTSSAINSYSNVKGDYIRYALTNMMSVNDINSDVVVRVDSNLYPCAIMMNAITCMLEDLYIAYSIDHVSEYDIRTSRGSECMRCEYMRTSFRVVYICVSLMYTVDRLCMKSMFKCSFVYITVPLCYDTWNLCAYNPGAQSTASTCYVYSLQYPTHQCGTNVRPRIKVTDSRETLETSDLLSVCVIPHGDTPNMTVSDNAECARILLKYVKCTLYLNDGTPMVDCALGSTCRLVDNVYSSYFYYYFYTVEEKVRTLNNFAMKWISRVMFINPSTEMFFEYYYMEVGNVVVCLVICVQPMVKDKWYTSIVCLAQVKINTPRDERKSF